MVASSYRPPIRGDKQDKKTHSQSTETPIAGVLTPVSALLDKKGSNVYTIQPGETIQEAVDMLREKNIGALIVTDSEGAIAGILSERDIVRKMSETPGKTLQTPIRDVMQKNVITCLPSDTVVNVLRTMSEKRFRHMPVREGDELLGMITIGDVVNYRITELEHEALRMRQLIVG